MLINLTLDAIRYKIPISGLYTLAEAFLFHFSGQEFRTLFTYEQNPVLFFANSNACLDAAMLWAHHAEGLELESYEYALTQWEDSKKIAEIIERECVFCEYVEKTLMFFLYKQYKHELPPFSEILTLSKNYPTTINNPHHMYAVLKLLNKELVQ